MRWTLALRRRQQGDLDHEAQRLWEWIEAVRPLHPGLALWRPVRRTRKEAEVAPPLTAAMVHDTVTTDHAGSELPSFGSTIGFCGTLDGGSRLSVSFNRPDPGDAGLTLYIGDELGEAIDTSEALADAIMHTTATVLDPTIGALDRDDHPGRNLNQDGPEPYRYIPGWKMFFHAASPYYARACELATRTSPAAGGAVLTFGTPDTYPTVLDQW